MAPQWFGTSRETSVGALIARRKYARAIEVLREELTFGARDPRVRMQLADVLVSAGRGSEAVPILIGLADEYANEGAGAKAIAILKKIQRLAPQRKDVSQRLSNLIREKDRGTRTTSRLRAVRGGPGGFSGPVYAKSVSGGKVASDTERIRAARAASWVPETGPAAQDLPPGVEAPLVPASERREAPPPGPEPPRAPEPPPAVAATAPGDEEVIEVSLEEFQGQVIDTISDVLQHPAAAEPGAELEIQEEAAPEDVAENPLFSSFSPEELEAVIAGLELLSYEPGDVIVLEGDPGDSLFIVTTGVVKAFLREPGPAPPRLARLLGEGEFFGEVSILSGRPRTATVTAATACELLELDRKTLDEITARHPNVRAVLEEFYVQRAGG
jgi:hypothetical protein